MSNKIKRNDCNIDYQNLLTDRYSGKITEEEFNEIFDNNCKDCFYMSDICMIGEE